MHNVDVSDIGFFGNAFPELFPAQCVAACILNLGCVFDVCGDVRQKVRHQGADGRILGDSPGLERSTGYVFDIDHVLVMDCFLAFQHFFPIFREFV